MLANVFKTIAKTPLCSGARAANVAAVRQYKKQQTKKNIFVPRSRKFKFRFTFFFSVLSFCVLCACVSVLVYMPLLEINDFLTEKSTWNTNKVNIIIWPYRQTAVIWLAVYSLHKTNLMNKTMQIAHFVILFGCLKFIILLYFVFCYIS